MIAKNLDSLQFQRLLEKSAWEDNECRSIYYAKIKIHAINGDLGMGVVEVELGCTQSIHDCVEDTELSSRESTNHHATRS
jgi:hypothetical protein